MDLSIIIVNYKTFDLTKETILSVINQKHDFKYEIIVVDNASNDGSLQKLKETFNNQIKFIKSDKNNGFAYANNLGFKNSKGRYILTLNSDTFVKEDTLNSIYHYIENNIDVGAVGSKLSLPNGQLDKASKRSFPNPKNSFYRLFHIPSKNSQTNNYNLDNLSDDGVYEVDCLSGAFMFIRRDAINDVGFFDDKFFMYGEDIDLCYRIKKANWKIVYYGKAETIHYKGSSSKKQKSKLIYEFYRAMYIFYKKHCKDSYSFFTNLIVYIGILILLMIKLFLNLFKR
ncbi:glycosyltransferase family 2 protein [Methanobrevibacter sp. DSM 116169]|uniref:glycosyltransferase family 2 protein n=1 Tax=Methanobrevibacter sp. DSM 116169 TaxID=3242727 RepID=UPI0038FCAAD4